MIGRWKKEGKHFCPNNKLAQEPQGNEENIYAEPDSKKRR
jgi:hypothetical protein